MEVQVAYTVSLGKNNFQKWSLTNYWYAVIINKQQLVTNFDPVSQFMFLLVTFPVEVIRMVSMFTGVMLNKGGPFVWHHHIYVDGPPQSIIWWFVALIFACH